jgi:magnesium transporter
MIVHARDKDGALRRAPDPHAALVDGSAVWIDLLSPDAREEATLEAVLDIDVPTASERGALEDSARFYEEGGTLVLIAAVVSREEEGGDYALNPVAFVLDRRRLVTERDCTPRAFEVGTGRASARIISASGGADVLMALLDGLVERTADVVMETIAAGERLSDATLAARKPTRLEATLRRLSQLSATASKCRDSLASLSRLARFAAGVADRHGLDRSRLEDFAGDVAALQHQAEALRADLTFLLDATLGLAGARQNETLKVMAVTTLLFVPPTLIASIFGMNFEHMTVFKDAAGPWAAIGLMAASSALILTIARLGRWL